MLSNPVTRTYRDSPPLDYDSQLPDDGNTQTACASGVSLPQTCAALFPDRRPVAGPRAPVVSTSPSRGRPRSFSSEDENSEAECGEAQTTPRSALRAVLAV